MKTRFVAYNRLGSKRGVLPNFLQAEPVISENELPVLRLHYPRNAKTSSRLENMPEIALEYLDSSGKWVEPQNARWVLQSTDKDHLEEVPTKTFTFIGIGEAMRGQYVYDNLGLEVNEEGRVKFGTSTPGWIINKVWDSAVLRGWKGFSRSFTSTHDSNGVAWPQSINMSFAVESTLESMIMYMVRAGLCDFSWSGRTLNLYANGTNSRDLSTGNKPTRFNLSGGPTGVDSAPSLTDREGMATHVVVLGENGLRWEFPTGAVLPEGRREVFLTYSGVDEESTARVFADPVIVKYANPLRNDTRQFRISEGVTVTPLNDYGVGDYVLIEQENGTWERMKIYTLSLRIDSSGTQGYIGLGDKIDTLLERLNEKVQRNGGTVINEGTNPPAPSNRKPSAPYNVRLTMDPYHDINVVLQSAVTIAFNHNGKDIRGAALNIRHYQVQYRPEGKAWSTLFYIDAPDTGGVYSPLPTFRADGELATYQFRVIAISTNSMVSDPSAVASVTTTRETTPPDKPKAPTVTTKLGVFTVKTDHRTWADNLQPPDYYHTIVEMATAPNDAVWLNVGTIIPPLVSTPVPIVGYGTRWFRLIAVDRSGNHSEPSDSVEATTTPLVDADIILKKINAAETEITNAGSLILDTGSTLSKKLSDADTAIGEATASLDALSKQVSPLESAMTALNTNTIPAMQLSIDGKTGTLRKTAAPTAEDIAEAGTRWEYWSSLNADGRLMETWRRTDSDTWIKDLISPTYLPLVDIGAGTFGSLAGGRIAANSISTQQLIVGLGENMIPWKASDVDVAVQTWEPHAAYNGTIFKLDRVGGRTDGPHGLMEAVIPASTDTATLEFRSGYTSRNGFIGHFNVEPNTKYKVTMWIRSGGVYPSGAPNVWLYSQSYLMSKSVESGSGRASARQVLTSGWTTLRFEFTTAPNAASLVLRLYQDQPGHVHVEDPFMARDGAALIAAGGINATHIDAESVGAAVGSFVKANIGNLVVTAGATMNTAVIDHLWTNVVRSRSITTDMLAVGSGPNSIADPFFENEATKSIRRSRSGQWGGWGRNTTLNLNWYGASGLAAVANSFYFDAGADAYAPGSMIAVEEGQKWRLKVKTNSTGGGARATARVLYKNGTMGYTAVGWTTTTGGGNGFSPVGVQDLERIYTVPADVAYIIPAVQFQAEATAAYIYGGATFGNMATASMIVDGSIVTRHLTVTADMTAALLRAKKVEALEIDVNSLTADSAWIGTMRGGILINDAVTTTMLKADAITAKHTITGAVVQTDAAANSGLRLDTVGLRAWNASGAETLRITRSTGDLTIYGGNIQTTSATSRGIKFNAQHMVAYNSAGKITFLLDAAEGDAQFDSRVLFGTKTTPRWVIVPWESVTQERAGIWLVNPAVSASGIGGSETGGMYMDGANATFANPLWLRGANGGGVNIMGRFNSSDMYSGVIHQADGLYHLQGANGSYFQSQVEFNGRIQNAGAPATTQVANVHMDANGTIWKTSSAARFKIDVQPLEVPESLIDVPIKDWFDKGEEDMEAELNAEPRPHTKSVANSLEAITHKRVAGVIAEEVLAAGGERYVSYNLEGQLEGVAYDRLALARTAILKRQLDAAIARIDELEGMMA